MFSRNLKPWLRAESERQVMICSLKEAIFLGGIHSFDSSPKIPKDLAHSAFPEMIFLSVAPDFMLNIKLSTRHSESPMRLHTTGFEDTASSALGPILEPVLNAFCAWNSC